MQLTFEDGYLNIIWEIGDIRPRDESHALYLIKRELNRKGHDLIKRRMWRDGHLVDDSQQYLRTRSPKSPLPHIAIYDHAYAIRDLAEDLRTGGGATLMVIQDIFSTTEDEEEKE